MDDKHEARNKAITKCVDQAEKTSKAVIKLLLLSAGESGKSTIFKQMRLINSGGYTAEEREAFRNIIWSNTIVSIKSICHAFDRVGIDKAKPVGLLENEIDAATADAEDLTPELAAIIKQARKHATTKEVLARRNQFQLIDSAEYHLAALDRISQPDCADD